MLLSFEAPAADRFDHLSDILKMDKQLLRMFIGDYLLVLKIGDEIRTYSGLGEDITNGL